MLVKVKFIKKSEFGLKGEERLVTDRAAQMYHAKGLIEDFKEEKEVPETKEEKQELETKEEKEVPETKVKKAKLTKAPKL